MTHNLELGPAPTAAPAQAEDTESLQITVTKGPSGAGPIPGLTGVLTHLQSIT